MNNTIPSQLSTTEKKTISYQISPPPYFQTPNDLVDHWLPHLGEAEVKVLLVVFRKTFGWHKDRDRISNSQMQMLTGLTRTNLIKASKSLAEKGIITREVIGPEGRQETYYELVIHGNSNNSYQSSCRTGTSPDTRLVPVLEKDPQKTSLQKTSKKSNKSDDDIGRSNLSSNKILSLEKETAQTQHNVYYQTTKNFISIIRKLNPKITEKSEATIKKWSEIFDHIIRIDKRTPEEIQQVFDFIEWDHFNAKGSFRWSYAIQSPQKLREHFASIYLQMLNKPKDKEQAKAEEANKQFDIIKENKNIAKLIISRVNPENQYKCKISDNCVYISPQKGISQPIGFNENGFKDQLENTLRKYGML